MNGDSPFYRLSPFIQEYIYRHGWTELRDIQVEAAQALFDTDAHLLLASGTASGKTEAAFLPVLTLLQQRPCSSVGILYIGPTKALINDQFYRLQGLLQEADIPVWHWHGDVSRSSKERLLIQPKGVLQITPESLESLLINRTQQLQALFQDLRFIIIDEVHVFMGSDRGLQILAQVQRINRYTKQEPRRIGLSATLGDYSLAEQWLGSGSKRIVITPTTVPTGQSIRLALEHFCRPDEESKESAMPPAEDDPYYRYIFDITRSGKALVFSNNRAQTEAVTASLRQIAEARQLPDVYHVHHGSISAPLREVAEAAMRDPESPAVTAATVTLELGIDLGQLERIVQLEAPLSVSSFLQRLGRSGRRGNPMEMWFVTSDTEQSGVEPVPELLPWQLLQSIAVIQLYLEERWIEPIEASRLPYSLLYHQTMSELAQGEQSPRDLARRVLHLPPFSSVDPEDYRQLLLHLLDIDHLQRAEDGKLIIGLAGERVVRSFKFYAVFADNEEFIVQDESREIGSIVQPPPPGERFALAGRTWEVIEIDPKRKLVQVKQISGRASISWKGAGGRVHGRILNRMRQVLLEDKEYRYLQPQARQRLREARRVAVAHDLHRRTVLPLGGQAFAVLPWMGSRAYRTLDRSLRSLGRGRFNIYGLGGVAPYFFTMLADTDSPEILRQAIVRQVLGVETGETLVGLNESPRQQKYDEYVPQQLLRKAFIHDQLDVREMKTIVRTWE